MTGVGAFDNLRLRGSEARREWSRREKAALARVQEVLDDSGVFGDQRATSVIFGVFPRSGAYFIEQVRGTADTTFSRQDIPARLAEDLLVPIQDAKWIGELEWDFGDGGPTLYALNGA